MLGELFTRTTDLDEKFFEQGKNNGAFLVWEDSGGDLGFHMHHNAPSPLNFNFMIHFGTILYKCLSTIV